MPVDQDTTVVVAVVESLMANWTGAGGGGGGSGYLHPSLVTNGTTTQATSNSRIEMVVTLSLHQFLQMLVREILVLMEYPHQVQV